MGLMKLRGYSMIITAIKGERLALLYDEDGNEVGCVLNRVADAIVEAMKD